MTPKDTKVQKAIKNFEFKLGNSPRGIRTTDLPTEPELVEYMKELLKNKKAVWLKELDGKIYFIKMDAPNNIKFFHWLPPQIKRKKS